MNKLNKGDHFVVTRVDTLSEAAGIKPGDTGIVNENCSMAPWVIMDDGKKRIPLLQSEMRRVEPNGTLPKSVWLHSGDRCEILFRRLGDSDNVQVGVLGTVMEDDDEFPYVLIDGAENEEAIYQDQLKRVDPEPLKVGDRFVFIRDNTIGGAKLGAKGEEYIVRNVIPGHEVHFAHVNFRPAAARINDIRKVHPPVKEEVLINGEPFDDSTFEDPSEKTPILSLKVAEQTIYDQLTKFVQEELGIDASVTKITHSFNRAIELNLEAA